MATWQIANILTLMSKDIRVIMVCNKIHLGPFHYVVTHMAFARAEALEELLPCCMSAVLTLSHSATAATCIAAIYQRYLIKSGMTAYDTACCSWMSLLRFAAFCPLSSRDERPPFGTEGI